MCSTVFSIVFFVVISHTCTTAIVTQTPKSEVLNRLYEALIDVSTRRNGNPRRSAVGVVGDSEGFILKTLWSNNFTPAMLTDTRMKIDNSVTVLNLPNLQVSVVAATSPKRFLALREEITDTIWWDNEVYFLKPNPTPDTKHQSSNIDKCPYSAFEEFGVRNAQSVCLDLAISSWTFNSNRFSHRTPKLLTILPGYKKMVAAFRLLEQLYRHGGQNFESLRFDKTAETGGYDPFYLVSRWPGLTHKIRHKFNELLLKAGSNLATLIEDLVVRNKQFVIDNIAIGLKSSAPLMHNVNNILDVMMVDPFWISTKNGLLGVSQS